MEMQVSHRVCTKVQKKGNIRKNKGRCRKNPTRIEREERREKPGGRMLFRSYPYARSNSPPHMSVSEYMGYLKSKSSLMIFDRHANLKYKYGNRHFWCRGYYVDTVGKYETAIRDYIRNQLQDDIANDQISLKELVDPFTGEPVK